MSEEVDQLLEEFRKDRRFMLAGEARAAGFEKIFGIVGKLTPGGIAVELTKYALENVDKFVEAIRSIIKGAKITIKVTCPDGMTMEVDSRESKFEKDLRTVVEQCGERFGEES